MVFIHAYNDGMRAFVSYKWQARVDRAFRSRCASWRRFPSICTLFRLLAASLASEYFASLYRAQALYALAAALGSSITSATASSRSCTFSFGDLASCISLLNPLTKLSLSPSSANALPAHLILLSPSTR